MSIHTKAFLLSLWFILKYILGFAAAVGVVSGGFYLIINHPDILLPIALTFGAIVGFTGLYFTTLGKLEMKEQIKRSK